MHSGKGGARSMCLVHAWAGPAPLSRAWSTHSRYEAFESAATFFALALIAPSSTYKTLFVCVAWKVCAYEHHPLTLLDMSLPDPSNSAGGTVRFVNLRHTSDVAALCPLSLLSVARVALPRMHGSFHVHSPRVCSGRFVPPWSMLSVLVFWNNWSLGVHCASTLLHPRYGRKLPNIW